MKVVSWRQVPHHWRLYLLVLPALGLILTFAYFPAASAVYHAFFRWDGDDIAEYIGLRNFANALTDEVLGRSFHLVLILIVANFLKMIPSIVTAVVIHRLASDRARYLYRVAFVIPMIIPEMVWLLIWKYFYDPTVGVLNTFLNATGLMGVLQALDSPATGLPALASALAPVRDASAGAVFGGVGGLALAAAALWALRAPGAEGGRGRVGLGVRAAAALVLGVAVIGYWPGQAEWVAGAATGAGRALRTAGALVTSRGAVVMAVLCGAALAVRRRRRGPEALKWAAAALAAVAAFFLVTTMLWPAATQAFAYGAPAWLGQSELLIPALVFWGFPWVGVISVLLYLAGLGNIEQDVYDAAEIDGCGWFRKFWNIELPLILTQVRLNLVLMIIGTLQGWGLIFILLGDTGGPKGAGMVPGLYMFRKAFTDMEAGYACAIGLLLFLLTLGLTMINNRYVRVQK